MFDFSFGELVVIGGVALIVLGPEKLPRVARTAGQWIGKAQRYVADVKADIQREVELSELKKLQEQVQASARELETSMHQNLHSIESELRANTGSIAGDASAGESPASPDWSSPSTETRSDDYPKAPPSSEELAARLDALQRDLAAAIKARPKYSPRSRAGRPLRRPRATR